jgi:3-oxoacyl-[acyl-carrier protein] reductase
VRLEGRVAVVTGAGRGIGAAIARALAADGAAVVVHHLRHGHEAAALVRELRASGRVAEAVRADLRRRDEVAALFDVAERLGGVHVLVNNAGWSEFMALGEIADAQIDEAMSVNFRAALWTMQEAAVRMADGGRIVNISTLGTTSPLAGQTLYAASKAAMEQLTTQGAVELAVRGITVNTVSPGSTRTELFREAVPFDMQSQLAQRPYFKRLGEPSDIASVVAFLGSADAGWITGQRIVVSGGQA